MNTQTKATLRNHIGRCQKARADLLKSIERQEAEAKQLSEIIAGKRDAVGDIDKEIDVFVRAFNTLYPDDPINVEAKKTPPARVKTAAPKPRKPQRSKPVPTPVKRASEAEPGRFRLREAIVEIFEAANCPLTNDTVFERLQARGYAGTREAAGVGVCNAASGGAIKRVSAGVYAALAVRPAPVVKVAKVSAPSAPAPVPKSAAAPKPAAKSNEPLLLRCLDILRINDRAMHFKEVAAKLGINGDAEVKAIGALLGAAADRNDRVRRMGGDQYVAAVVPKAIEEQSVNGHRLVLRRFPGNVECLDCHQKRARPESFEAFTCEAA